MEKFIPVVVIKELSETDKILNAIGAHTAFDGLRIDI